MILDILKDVDGIYKLYVDPIKKAFVTIDDKFFPADHYQLVTFPSIEQVSQSPVLPLYIPQGTEVNLNIVDRCPPVVEKIAEPITEEDLKAYAPREYQELKEKGQISSIVSHEVAQGIAANATNNVVHSIREAIQEKQEETLIKVKSELLKQLKALYALKGKAKQEQFKSLIHSFCKGIIFIRPEFTKEINQFLGEML